MLQLLRSNPRFLMVVVAFSLFTIVPVMSTTLQERANVQPENTQYWIAILLISESLTTLLTSPLAGYLTDLHPRREVPFLLSLALMVLAILLFSPSLFIAGRCIQGAATSVVMISGFAMVLDAIPEDEVAVTLGWLSMASTAGFALRPALGGVLYRFGGWWAMFGTLLGLLGVDFGLRCVVVEHRRMPGVDEPGEAVVGNDKLEFKAGSEFRVITEKTDVDAEGQSRGSVPNDGEAFAMLVLLHQPRMLVRRDPPHLRPRPLHLVRPRQGLIFIPTALPAILDPFYGYCISLLGIRTTTFTAFLLLIPTPISLRFISASSFPHKAGLVNLLTLLGTCLVIIDVAFFVETDDIVQHVQETQPEALSPKGAIAQSLGLRTMAFYLGILIGPLWGGMIVRYRGWKLTTATFGASAGGTGLAMLKVGKPWRSRSRGESTA
ncbi:unnamed protein product [Zymoseptoria tritici ST99CH_1E4]|uniref:Major facilitator superfamily (MFS) profile domain-containing protein n=1 Tax=Zymoseptoria tritici ST99CH_1E4 TaxID=1276532 RepID=A0A2H1GUF0_ZYMTR|nr:unnamed protein product [Zymoseptoria tritici ST99CH_1E4]